MYTTLDDARTLVRGAIAHTAQTLGIAIADGRLDVALEAIRTRDPVVYSALDGFLSGWAAWFRMHQELEASGSVGRMTPAQQKRLADAIDDKEAGRNLLLDLLRNP